MSDDTFYFAFEKAHRGSREVIRSRLDAYIPFLFPFVETGPKPIALDLGCGRGEWLELMGELAFEAHGVDLDSSMLRACESLGLSASYGDALQSLVDLEDDTLSVLSAFHLVEHLPFEVLNALVKEALRVLRPGGLLILETPNPENLTVGANNFYIDPTHERPIPPPLLAFLPAHHGFHRQHVLRLQEPRDLSEGKVPGLADVLGKASPDYAVVAQKSADDEFLARFNEVFNRAYGIHIDELAARYDDSIAGRFARLEERVGDSLLDTQALKEEIAKVVAIGTAVRTESLELQARVDALDANARQSRMRAEALAAEARDLRQSFSWRITRPLRLGCDALRTVALGVRRITDSVVGRLISTSQRPIGWAIRRVMRRPRLAGWINALVLRFPAVHTRLRRIADLQGIDVVAFAAETSSVYTVSSSGLNQLTRRGREIADDLSNYDASQKADEKS